MWGFPGIFTLCLSCCPDSVGWSVLDVPALLRWAPAKWIWNSFQNSYSYKFVHWFFSCTVLQCVRGCMCKGTCLSNGLLQRPCMGKAVQLVQLPAPPSESWTESLLLKWLFRFLLSIFAQHSTVANQAVWPALYWLGTIESQGLQFLLLRLSASLGRTGIPSERWSICGCFPYFYEMQFIQTGSLEPGSGGGKLYCRESYGVGGIGFRYSLNLQKSCCLLGWGF